MSTTTRRILSRRTFLRAGGVSLALPFLDAMLPRLRSEERTRPPRRLICVCTVLGLHAPLFFPTGTGRGYKPSPYLDVLKGHRDDFTVFSGFAHEGHEASGHESESAFLTAARNPQLPGFRNTVSLDQFVAGKVGAATRFPSLTLASVTSHAQSLAVNRSGVNLPAESKPSRVFARLFLDGTPDEIKREIARLAEGQSVLDALSDQSRRLAREVGPRDRSKLDEYFSSVREAEQRLQSMQVWARKPKPKVSVPMPKDVTNMADQIARMDVLFDLMPLALQTDSTRVITMLIGQSDQPIPLPGVNMGHHTLSHHGQVPEKIEQLHRIEEAEIKSFGALLTRLKASQEGGKSLLTSTTVLLGSNLGNANNHSTANLPILLAGGGFKHGQHLIVTPNGRANQNAPLSNLFVSMLHNLGIETDRFGGSTGAVTGLEKA